MRDSNRRICGISVLLAIAIAGAAPAWAEKQHFEIPPGPVGVALLQLCREAHLTLASTPQVNAVFTQGASGDFEPMEALQLLLKGTPLHFAVDHYGYITVLADANLPLPKADDPPTKTVVLTTYRRPRSRE